MKATPRNIVRRLEAYGSGIPVPRGETKTVPVAEPEALAALAFVRMGGESRPWAIGFQVSGSAPLIRSVPDGRQTEPIGEILVELAVNLCGFLGSPLFLDEEELAQEPEGDLKQIWLPNAAHLSMLHLINLRYTFARADEGSARTQALQALGRICGYLFREAARADEVGVVDASRALREAYTFPVDEVRGQHLGLLVSYLEANSTAEELKIAAETAERLPVSPTLDPALERDELEPMVTSFNESNRNGDVVSTRRLAEEIGVILASEVERRLELTLKAAEILREDPRQENAGTGDLVAASLGARTWEYLNLEIALAAGQERFPPSAETDKLGKSAARRFIRMSASDETRTGALLMNDRELIDEAVAAGDGVRGVVTKVDRRVPEGKVRSAPYWEVEMDLSAPLRLKPGSNLLTVGLDPAGGYVEKISQQDSKRVVTICMNKRSVGEGADSQVFIGLQVTLLPTQSSFSERKLSLLSRDPGPGNWLTHGEGARPATSRPYSGDPLEEIAALRKS